MNQPRVPAGLRKLIVGSLFVHAFALLLFVLGVDAHSGPKEPENVVITKLVRLGKERPEHLLPRLPKEPPPPAPTPKPKKPEPKPKPEVKAPPKPSAKPSPKPAAQPAPKPMSAIERARQLKSTSSALDRLRNTRKNSDAEIEGSQKGSQQGTVSSITQAIIGNKYMNEIHQCVKSNWTIEGIDPSRIGGLSAVVFVRISARGTLSDYRIERSSGVTAFDRAVEKAIRRCGQVSRPPREIRKQILKDGVEIEFRP